jgi:hypothetical protein
MDKDSDPGLEMTEEIQMEAQALKSLAVDLECYSLCLWTVANKRTGGHGSKR